MSIYFDEQNRIFHLTTLHSDYQIKIVIYYIYIMEEEQSRMLIRY